MKYASACCRCSYWLDIQTASPPKLEPQEGLKPETDDTKEPQDNARRPPLRAPTQTPQRPASPPPALEFGLLPSGAVTVISVPALPASSFLQHSLQAQDSATQAQGSSAASSVPQHSADQALQPLRLVLDLDTLDIQQILLQAAACSAAVQLGKHPLCSFK